MSQVHIEIGKLEDNLTEIFYYPNRVEDEITFTLETVVFGRFVNIWLEKTEHLTICEVEIYCNEGLFLYDKHSPHHTSHKLGSFGQTHPVPANSANTGKTLPNYMYMYNSINFNIENATNINDLNK